MGLVSEFASGGRGGFVKLDKHHHHHQQRLSVLTLPPPYTKQFKKQTAPFCANTPTPIHIKKIKKRLFVLRAGGGAQTGVEDLDAQGESAVGGFPVFSRCLLCLFVAGGGVLSRVCVVCCIGRERERGRGTGKIPFSDDTNPTLSHDTNPMHKPQHTTTINTP